MAQVIVKDIPGYVLNDRRQTVKVAYYATEEDKELIKLFNVKADYVVDVYNLPNKLAEFENKAEEGRFAVCEKCIDLQCELPNVKRKEKVKKTKKKRKKT